MKQSLQLRVSQHLALTPQLQQSIRLLQLSTLELNQEIEQFLQDNPLLEREDADTTATFSPSEDAHRALERVEVGDKTDSAEPAEIAWGNEIGGGASARNHGDDGDSDPGEIQTAVASLRDHLLAQLALTTLPDRERALVGFLIEALDEDGYLSQRIEDLVDMLDEVQLGEAEDRVEELRIALKHVQNFDPCGVGARNPRECLELQLRDIPGSDLRARALVIVRDHLDQLAARDFSRIKKALACSDDQLREAHALILSLNPRPGAQYTNIDTRYIVPDVLVRKLRGRWTTSLNREAMPRLRVNRMYADLLRKNRASGGLSGQLQEAKWLIKNVQQRFDTIQRVTEAIVERQRAFFDHGEVAMRPLTLREIADTLGLHESTISRVTTQKYLASPRGVYELKYFFGSHVATDSGGAASSTAIRALIKQLIGAEDGHKPLSDSRIAEILGEQGIVVARRTVAKYRESMGIPPVNLRKSL
jgi:RNA polymerase sigma-54 factor